MKLLGAFLIIGALIILAFYLFVMNSKTENLTPIPDNNDLRIIYLTPTK